MGSAYDRTIYAFGVETTEEQDDAFIRTFNSRTNKRHFNLFFFNCADFARKTVDFYYPHAIHRSLIADAGIMTPKQAARSLVSYSKHHSDCSFRFSSYHRYREQFLAAPQFAACWNRWSNPRDMRCLWSPWPCCILSLAGAWPLPGLKVPASIRAAWWRLKVLRRYRRRSKLELQSNRAAPSAQ